ncbi:MAG: NADPH:quinone reductase [Chloroflexota bacterium]|nr:NADPH:quinone reductase [Chloroflexota bacterium]
MRALGADLIVKATWELAAEIRRVLPDGAANLIDGAALNEAILPAIAGGGRLATLKGWNGPADRKISVHPISSLEAAIDTALLDRPPARRARGRSHRLWQDQCGDGVFEAPYSFASRSEDRDGTNPGA